MYRLLRFSPVIAGFLTLAFLVQPVSAKEIWHYDDGPDDLTALAGSKMHPQYGHPGFVQNEAFGVLFKPKKDQYPVEIVSVELIMAAATSALKPTEEKISATIEIWNDKSESAEPASAKPLWTVSTADFFNSVTGKPGTPIQGNTVMVYEFKGSKPGDKPPIITAGNIRVMIRLNSAATDLSTYWGKADCTKLTVAGMDIGCGCQRLAALTDTATTPKTEIMHIVWPIGTCSGKKAWRFVEDINNGLIQMKGDFRVRMGVKGSGGNPTTDAGSTDASGADAGGSDAVGTSDAGAPDSGPADTGTPDAGPGDTSATKPLKPVIQLVTPSTIAADKPSEITLVGEGFQSGAVVKVGGSKAAVSSVSAVKIVATALPGLQPGFYAVVVENPNGQVGFKDKAVEVKAAAVVDAGPTAPDAANDAGNIGAGELKLDLVDPRCVASGSTTQITVFGSGFATGMTLQAGGKMLVDVTVLKSTKLTAVVPSGLAAGKQPLIAEFNGATATLADALEVDCGSGKGAVDSGCSAGPMGLPSGARGGLLVVVLLMGLVVGLRRRQRV